MGPYDKYLQRESLEWTMGMDHETTSGYLGEEDDEDEEEEEDD